MKSLPTKWSLEFSESALKDFKKLDSDIRQRITKFIDNSLLRTQDPRLLGKPLHGNLKEFWSYRVGDHRLICEIFDHNLTIITLRIAHRSKVYKNVHYLNSVS